MKIRAGAALLRFRRAGLGAFCSALPLLAAVPGPAPQGSDGYMSVGFEKLGSFEYVTPDADAPANPPKPPPKDQIPGEIRALNNRKVALRGFMLPLTNEGGLVTELLVMRDQSACCYGLVPKINQWVDVHMKGKGVKPLMDRIVTFYGTLKVGEEIENGCLVGIYEMDGDRMAGPDEPARDPRAP